MSEKLLCNVNSLGNLNSASTKLNAFKKYLEKQHRYTLSKEDHVLTTNNITDGFKSHNIRFQSL